MPTFNSWWTVPLRFRSSFLTLFALAAAAAESASPGGSESIALELRSEAMAGENVAYSWVSELTTRIGPRPAGSTNDRLAAEWAAERFKSLGFENVRIETFPLTAWVRGAEHAEIVTPNSQPLAISALGESPPTPAEGVEGEVVLFPTLQDLSAAPKGSLTGKIAMVTRRMVRMQDVSGYAAVAPARLNGPAEAASRGAIGFLLRSVSTDNRRLPHTGSTVYVDGRVSIPSFALSVPDADQVERIAATGQAVRVRLFSSASYVNDAQSQNVVAEIRGKGHPQEIVMLGAHLDSWDLGTGAVDDGAGGAIITAAAKLIRDLPQRPQRTVRVVLFGAEEVAQPVAPFYFFGGNAYAINHKSELALHMLTAESDMGADRIYALRLPKGVTPSSEWARTVFRILAPIGILPTDQVTETGEDIGPSVDTGVPTFALYQDLTRYFDLHHSADDTLDKIDRQQCSQLAGTGTYRRTPYALGRVTWLNEPRLHNLGVRDLTNNGGNIEAEIVELLAGRVPAGVHVSAQTQIVGGLGLDSVAFLDFIMDLEDRFDISIPLGRVAEVRTIAELSRAIDALTRAAG
jgi:acyl carrier protein